MQHLTVYGTHVHSPNCITITMGSTLGCQIQDLDIHSIIDTHLSAGAHDAVYWRKCIGKVYSIMLPLMTLTLLSVYCLFYYVVWLDRIPVYFTFVYQFLPMDSDNDL